MSRVDLGLALVNAKAMPNRPHCDLVVRNYAIGGPRTPTTILVNERERGPFLDNRRMEGYAPGPFAMPLRARDLQPQETSSAMQTPEESGPQGQAPNEHAKGVRAVGGPTAPVFVLIHGTFAREAPWVRDGSKLRRALRQRYGEPAAFFEFLWSGDNSHAARVGAGEDLRSFLMERIEENPGRPVHLIAHSHGGNVALYALRDRGLANRIAGLVTMGTPFFDCRKRGIKIPLQVTSAVVTFLICMALIAGVLVGGAITSLVELPVWAQAALALGAFVGLPALVILAALRDYPGRPTLGLFRMLKHRQTQAWNAVRLPSGPRPPILRAAINGDEAGRALLLSWLAGDLPHRVWTWLFRVLAVLIFIEVVVFVGLGTIVLYPMLLAERAGWRPGFLSEDVFSNVMLILIFGVAGPVILVAILLLLLQLPMIALPLAARRVVYGRESIYQAWLLDIRPSLDPPAFALAPAFYRVKRTFRTLNHSRIYDHEQFFEDLIAWLAEPTSPQPPPIPTRRKPGFLARLYRKSKVVDAILAQAQRNARKRAERSRESCA